MTNIKPCPGMQTLIDLGMIELREENVDEKGLATTVTLLGPKGGIWIKNCPCCGKKIFNLAVPKGECENLEVCPDCGGMTDDGPYGPWCPKCDPDAPARFHVEESGPHY